MNVTNALYICVCIYRLEILQNFYSKKVLHDVWTGVWELLHKEKTN